MLHALHPDTVVRWHRQGFSFYWRWKSRGPKSGRPANDAGLRKLIRKMQAANIGWGAPRIHGELLKLGIEISQTTVSNYMARYQKPPSQTWRAFLGNHTECLAAIDFFTVPTAGFRVRYVFIVLSHDRRRVLHFNVTEHPTAQWTAQQLVEAFPFDSAPRRIHTAWQQEEPDKFTALMLRHITPVRFEHINFRGVFAFHIGPWRDQLLGGSRQRQTGAAVGK